MAQKTTTMLQAVVLAGAASVLLANAAAGQGRVLEDHEWCDQRDRDRGYFCEVREMTMSPRGNLAVDARPNGGIQVNGWDRDQVLILARVTARADTDGEARDIASDVRIDASGSSIESDGPRTGRDESWSVSYRISVPRRMDLSLESTNGGISVLEVSGAIDFETSNGGVHLTDLGGSVRGHTTNGGLTVELSGSEWQGSGIDARTTNGGVTLHVPEGYNAHLEASTTNGGLHFDFPITVQGRVDRRMSVDLGDGGAPIRVRTTNGGVTVKRRKS